MKFKTTILAALMAIGLSVPSAVIAAAAPASARAAKEQQDIREFAQWAQDLMKPQAIIIPATDKVWAEFDNLNAVPASASDAEFASALASLNSAIADATQKIQRFSCFN